MQITSKSDIQSVDHEKGMLSYKANVWKNSLQDITTYWELNDNSKHMTSVKIQMWNYSIVQDRSYATSIHKVSVSYGGEWFVLLQITFIMNIALFTRGYTKAYLIKRENTLFRFYSTSSGLPLYCSTIVYLGKSIQDIHIDWSNNRKPVSPNASSQALLPLLWT